MCKGNYVFQPGDIVRRKASELDSYWCYYMEGSGFNPSSDFIVDAKDFGSITLKGDMGTWAASYFDLVHRAGTPETIAPSPSTLSSVVPTINAGTILQNAATEMQDRAASRDTPEGERSMGRCVKAFNAMFGTELTETQGWQFMELLKMARSAGGEFRLDDFTDGVAYAALAGECEARLKQSV